MSFTLISNSTVPFVSLLEAFICKIGAHIAPRIDHSMRCHWIFSCVRLPQLERDTDAKFLLVAFMVGFGYYGTLCIAIRVWIFHVSWPIFQWQCCRIEGIECRRICWELLPFWLAIFMVVAGFWYVCAARRQHTVVAAQWFPFMQASDWLRSCWPLPAASAVSPRRCFPTPKWSKWSHNNHSNKLFAILFQK